MRPTRYKREFAVAQTVADMKRRFVYPDEDSQPRNPVVGGSGGAPRFVVAAADASDISKRKADAICPGVNDQVTLQGVVDQFGNDGGLLILTEGVYNLSELWTVSGPTWVRGAGNNATFIAGSADLSALVSPGTGGKLSDVWVGNGSSNSNAEGVRMTGQESLLDNCVVSCNGGVAIRMSSALTMVRNCYARNATFGIRHTSGTRFWILNNYVEDVTTGIEINNNLGQVRGNTVFSSGNGIAGTADDSIILANIITAGGTPVSVTGTGNVIDHNVT